MSLLHSSSHPALTSSVDLFSLPPTNTTVDYSLYGEYQPVVNIQDCSSKIDFKIPANGAHYLDLFDSFLYLKVIVTNKDGTDLADGEDVSPVNCFLHALFSQVDVYLTSQLVSTSNNAYAYRALIETLLSCGDDHRLSQGGCYMSYYDTNGGVADDTNHGYKTRKNYIARSRKLELIDKLRFDLANQHRYILNDVSVTISLTRSPDAFALVTGTNKEFKIKILKASYYVRKQVLYPSIILAHQRLLEKGHVAKYPHKRTHVKYFTIANGNSGAVEENLFNGSIPARIVVALLSSSAFNGNFQENPLTFKHYDLRSIGLTVNNIPVPVQLNFDSDEYLLAYYLLFTSTGIANQDSGIGIERNAFKRTYPMFAFDIVQGTSNNALLDLNKSGSVRLELKFGKALPEALHCVIYSEHQGLLEIDKFRQIVNTE